MIQLLRDNVAVTPIFDPDKSPGGIWIPDIAKERCDQGIVKYCGPEVKELKNGDYVIFSGYTGSLIKLEDEGLLIVMAEPFVSAVLTEPANVEVDGLYFRGPDGFFRATYEMTVELIAEAFKNSQYHKQLGIKNKLESRPTIKEIKEHAERR